MKDFFNTRANRDKVDGVDLHPLDRMLEDGWITKPTSPPPDWAEEMDDDEEWQREMGAEELWVRCRYCGEWTKSVSAFCCKEHKTRWIEHQKILKKERNKFYTRLAMGVKL